MARPSRAERRRMTARDAAVSTPKRANPVVDVVAPDVESSTTGAESARLVRTTRRVARTVEPVDYATEYAIISHDLRRIALWGALMIAIMIGIRFSGLV